MANTQALVLPLERGVCVPLVLFLVVELVLGVRALYLIVGAQALKFHLMLINSVPDSRKENQCEDIELQELTCS